jgi:hypothetical protein
MLGVFAEFETNLRRERQIERINAAKVRGVYKGRKPSIDVDEVLRLHQEEDLGPTAIAHQLGIGRASVCRVPRQSFRECIITSAGRCDRRSRLHGPPFGSSEPKRPPSGKMRLPSHETEFDLVDSLRPVRYRDNALRTFIHSKQRAAERFAAAFVPRTRFGVFLRNQVIKRFRVPAIAKIAIGRDIRDQLELPRYHL